MRMPGGTKSKLHRQTPYKHKWAQLKDGDLSGFVVEMVRERGPESVAITKIKGHATQRVVDEGKVEEREKQGNDQADKAADEGATKSQGKVQRFAELYAWRHGPYRKFMTRIQQYIVALRKEEKRLKQEDEKETDLFEKKEGGKQQVQKHLRYAKTGEAFKLHMRSERKEWCEGEMEKRYTEKVQRMVGTLEWKETEDEGGCITWIELFAMYAIHGGCEEEKERETDPLKAAPMLQKQIADFKKAVRMTKQHTMKESQEWIIETSYVAIEA